MNAHYKKLRALVALLTDEQLTDEIIFDAMTLNKTPVSKSALQGWRVNADHKNYRRMTNEQLQDVIDALHKYFTAQQECELCGYVGIDFIDNDQTCPKCKMVQ